jgi:hypothetical protein
VIDVQTTVQITGWTFQMRYPEADIVSVYDIDALDELEMALVTGRTGGVAEIDGMCPSSLV